MQAINQRVLETPNLLLRELSPEIFNELFTAHTDEYIMSFLGLTTNEELSAERDKWQLGMTTYRTSYKSFLMQEKTSGKIVGKAGFHNWYAMHRRAELGYAMTDESAKRKGYTTEAVKAIIAHGFDNMDLNRIEAFASPDNTASVKILESSGFTREGLLRSHFFKNGVMEDSACFGLLLHEYEASNK